MAISELHHVVIQALMSRRNMSEKTAKVVYAKCVEASGGEDGRRQTSTDRGSAEDIHSQLTYGPSDWPSTADEHCPSLTPNYHTLAATLRQHTSPVDPEEAPDYVDILDEINSELEPFGFGIKRFMDEFTGRAWVAFCNVKSDEIAKVATEYGPQEISYFRTLVRARARADGEGDERRGRHNL